MGLPTRGCPDWRDGRPSIVGSAGTHRVWKLSFRTQGGIDRARAHGHGTCHDPVMGGVNALPRKNREGHADAKDLSHDEPPAPAACVARGFAQDVTRRQDREHAPAMKNRLPLRPTGEIRRLSLKRGQSPADRRRDASRGTPWAKDAATSPGPRRCWRGPRSSMAPVDLPGSGRPAPRAAVHQAVGAIHRRVNEARDGRERVTRRAVRRLGRHELGERRPLAGILRRVARWARTTGRRTAAVNSSVPVNTGSRSTRSRSVSGSPRSCRKKTKPPTPSRAGPRCDAGSRRAFRGVTLHVAAPRRPAPWARPSPDDGQCRETAGQEIAS
jgi:hypothetical protein